MDLDLITVDGHDTLCNTYGDLKPLYSPPPLLEHSKSGPEHW